MSNSWYSLVTSNSTGQPSRLVSAAHPAGIFPPSGIFCSVRKYSNRRINRISHPDRRIPSCCFPPLHNLRLVAHIIKKYYSSGEDPDDLISIGTIGLIKGISTFDPAKQVRLTTYASRCIENEILMYFRSIKKLSREVSLEEPIEQSSESGTLSLMDVLHCEDHALERVENSDRCEMLFRCLHTALDARERDILTLRYGLSGSPPLTQREVASRRGISRSYVSRLEKRAVCKLADAMNPPPPD